MLQLDAKTLAQHVDQPTLADSSSPTRSAKLLSLGMLWTQGVAWNMGAFCTPKLAVSGVRGWGVLAWADQSLGRKEALHETNF